MIRIERVWLPPGMRAFARHENGAVFVYVPRGASPRERVAAIQEALRAAPDAGWRSGHDPVLLPALAGGAGLPWAPGRRRGYWALLTAAVAVAAGALTLTVLYGSGAPRTAAGAPVTLQPGGPGPGPGRTGGTGGVHTSSASPGTVPGQLAGRSPGPRGPKPQSSGTPVPVPTPGPSPTPGKSPSPGTSPTPGMSPTQPPPTSGHPTPGSSTTSQPGPASPSPSKSPSGGSPAVCVVVLGVTICVG